jgi:hypothetical protein
MKARGIFSAKHEEIGEIIVADVNGDAVRSLVDPSGDALDELILQA